MDVIPWQVDQEGPWREKREKIILVHRLLNKEVDDYGGRHEAIRVKTRRNQSEKGCTTTCQQL